MVFPGGKASLEIREIGMTRPKGATSDPIGSIFKRVEKDIEYITKRCQKLRAAKRKMNLEIKLTKQMVKEIEL